MYLFKIDDEVRLYNRPLGKVPVLSDAVLLAKIWKPRERAGKEWSTPCKSPNRTSADVLWHAFPPLRVPRSLDIR